MLMMWRKMAEQILPATSYYADSASVSSAFREKSIQGEKYEGWTQANSHRMLGLKKEIV